MADGILKTCTSCNKEQNCCCNFNFIDFPILSNNEYNLLVDVLKVDKNNFAPIAGGGYYIIAKNGVCPFYKNKCTIYKNRPNDCKLFPFDIKLIDSKYHLILYKLKCFNHIDMSTEDVDDIVESIKPYITTFSKKELNLKMNKLDYVVIKEIKFRNNLDS